VQETNPAWEFCIDGVSENKSEVTVRFGKLMGQSKSAQYRKRARRAFTIEIQGMRIMIPDGAAADRMRRLLRWREQGKLDDKHWERLCADLIRHHRLGYPIQCAAILVRGNHQRAQQAEADRKIAVKEQPATCGARTRNGTPCKRRPVPGKRRCHLHGGRSTGAKTSEGRARLSAMMTRRWALWRATGQNRPGGTAWSQRDSAQI